MNGNTVIQAAPLQNGFSNVRSFSPCTHSSAHHVYRPRQCGLRARWPTTISNTGFVTFFISYYWVCGVSCTVKSALHVCIVYSSLEKCTCFRDSHNFHASSVTESSKAQRSLGEYWWKDLRRSGWLGRGVVIQLIKVDIGSACSVQVTEFPGRAPSRVTRQVTVEKRCIGSALRNSAQGELVDSTDGGRGQAREVAWRTGRNARTRKSRFLPRAKFISEASLEAQTKP